MALTGPPTRDVAILHYAELLTEINVTTRERFGIKDDYIWIDTVHGKLRMKATLSDLTHERIVSIPHGCWLSESPVPDRGVFEICSNVLVDDAIENCDVVLGSSTLDAMQYCISGAEPPPERMVTQRGREATLSAAPVEQEIVTS